MDTQLKLHTVELELARLDELAAIGLASQGRSRVCQPLRRSCCEFRKEEQHILGPKHRSGSTPVQVRAEAAPQPSGTDRVLAALNQLAGKPETFFFFFFFFFSGDLH